MLADVFFKLFTPIYDIPEIHWAFSPSVIAFYKKVIPRKIKPLKLKFMIITQIKQPFFYFYFLRFLRDFFFFTFSCFNALGICSHKCGSLGLSNVNSSNIMLQCLGRPTPAVLVYRFWVNDAAEWSGKNDQWHNEKDGGKKNLNCLLPPCMRDYSV